ncbi:NepR family anti-sigma factor [Pelagibacterium sp.]|uniref:NepR family anti-sigma factor n=2 Tax=Pelagibacterium sp. TaxID=1967288 RepID=UPI003BA9D17A
MELFLSVDVFRANNKSLCGVNVTQLSSKNNMIGSDQDEKIHQGEDKPSMGADSRAFIGLKLRELYDDVVAEPVPDRLLELLGKLGDDDKPKSE